MKIKSSNIPKIANIIAKVLVMISKISDFETQQWATQTAHVLKLQSTFQYGGTKK